MARKFSRIIIDVSKIKYVLFEHDNHLRIIPKDVLVFTYMFDTNRKSLHFMTTHTEIRSMLFCFSLTT